VQAKIGINLWERAASNFQKISATPDALVAATEIGVGPFGVTAMHDVTEGGVFSALYEVAKASDQGMIINKKNIGVSEETKAVCEVFELDPYITLGEGALVITCHPSRVQELIEVLSSRDTTASHVGEIVEAERGVTVSADGVQIPITGVAVDPYWLAYYKSSK